MSGKIKTDSSTWANVVDIQIKKTDNSWGLAKSAWVKTDSTTWVRWFLGPISDTFTRSTSGSLGTADTGETWSNISGVWYSNGSQAQSDTSASSYPIATITYGVSDVTISAAVGQGTGVATWVTDANNWYALVPYQTQVNSTYACNCTCNGHYQSYSYPVYYSCANCSACGSYTSGGSTSTYNATCTSTQTGSSYAGSASLSYTCPSGGYLSSTRCCTDSTTTSTQNVSIGCYSAFSGCPNPYNGYYVNEVSAPGICGCPTGANKHCCYYTTTVTTTNYCSSSYSATAVYSCPSGQTVSGASCYSPTYSTTCTCPSGGSLSGTTCTVTNPGTTTCYSCQNSSCGVNYYASGSTFISGGTYPNCDSYGGSCQTCGTLTNAYYVRLLQSSNGTISNLTGDISVGSAVASVRLNTQGNVLSYQAYAGSDLSSLLTSGSYTVTSPTTTNNHGIIKAPSSYGQSSVVDNFRVSG